MINKEVQQLAESTIYAYNDVFIIYDFYSRNIETTRIVLQILATSSIPIGMYIRKLLSNNLNHFPNVNDYVTY